MKYTFSDEEDGGSDALSTRRSNRQSGASTPAEPSGPTFTASGRQVRSRHGGPYGESTLSNKNHNPDQSAMEGLEMLEHEGDQSLQRGRPRRIAEHNGVRTNTRPKKRNEGYDSSESTGDDTGETSSRGWDGEEDDDEADELLQDDDKDEDVEMSNDDEKESDDEDPRRSLVVSLRYLKGQSFPPPPHPESIKNERPEYSTDGTSLAESSLRDHRNEETSPSIKAAGDAIDHPYNAIKPL